MKLAKLLKPAPLVVGLSVLSLAMGLLTLLILMYGIYADNRAQIDYLEPRIARLTGLTMQQEALQDSSSRMEADLSMLIYQEGDTATRATEIQQRIREVLGNAGLSITGSRLLPIRQEQGFDTISLDITAKGGIDALEAALLGMHHMRPIVLVSGLNIQPDRPRRGETTQELTIRLELTSFKVAQ